MKVWDYLYVYTGTDKWTEVVVYEQPWWCVARAELYHKYICMRSNSWRADMRCFDYSWARKKTLHTFKQGNEEPP